MAINRINGKHIHRKYQMSEGAERRGILENALFLVFFSAFKVNFYSKSLGYSADTIYGLNIDVTLCDSEFKL